MNQVQPSSTEAQTRTVTESRRPGTVNRALIVSVSDYILHHAQCHVIVCRHKDHAHKDRERNHSYSSCRLQAAQLNVCDVAMIVLYTSNLADVGCADFIV
ncbi:hypothetical protein RRG08_059009 [Elysia crispata]|uniref:Uncharacterized protein n=1 Tax=Elysia crispata TaxID=231223 RepID=A0AAE0Y949_9GAST|nr:hypothetical protein RRG08_059009 [Elysia crispata]